MDQNELLAFYTLLQMAPGKNMQAKVNFLQDLGLKFGGTGAAKQFIEEPAPVLANPMDVFGSDPKVAEAFGLIKHGGYDPIAALKEAGLPTTASPLGGIDYVDIATKFAQAESENQVKQQEWEAKQQYNRARFEADTANAAPLTVKDVVGQSAYDQWSGAYGGDLSADELVKQYKKRRAEAQAPQERNPNVPVRGSLPKAEQVLPDKLQQYLDMELKKQFAQRLEQGKRTMVPSERGAGLLSILQAQRALGGS